MSAAEDYLQQIQALNLSDGLNQAPGLLLTPLGRHLSALPCSPQIGRLLVFGCLLSCVSPVSCVAALGLMGRGGPFLMASGADKDIQKKIESAKVLFLPFSTVILE